MHCLLLTQCSKGVISLKNSVWGFRQHR